jgi:amino acid transporter
MQVPAERQAPARGLGTFLGVFTPTALTILGVILYLRLGWVVGNIGLAPALLVVVLANAITLVTTLSFSSVATNARVGVGGAYFLVSRSLGPEIGGAIGLPLFLSQAFSVTLYAYGLAESLRFAWPGLPLAPTAAGIVVAVAALAVRGAGFALRTQLPILAGIALSLAALAWGALAAATPGALAPAPSEVGFWAAFAVFFPAVTGIMAGLGFSGDLRDPARSIPRGALAAQLTGFAVYLAVPVLLWMSADTAALRSDPLVWTTIAPLGAWLVLPGLWGAVFSSAVGSVLGAPRTLQALAMDHLAPGALGRVSGRSREPRLGLAVTFGIALAAVGLGNLNAVAVAVSMFFLTVYGVLNLSAALEDLAGDPFWRPAIRVPWFVSGLGAIACFAVMLLVSPAASAVAVTTELALWLWLKRRQRHADWGDVRRGFYEATIRSALIRLAERPATPRSWRPNVLVFTQDVERDLALVRFGDWFSQHRGVVTVCELAVGDLWHPRTDLLEREARVRRFLRDSDLEVFADVQLALTREGGVLSVAQSNGIAGLESNTLLVPWPEGPDELARVLGLVRPLEALEKSLIIGRARVPPPPTGHRPRTVHVWWRGHQRNIHLMLLLAHLLSRNPAWRDTQIHVMSLVSNETMAAETTQLLERLLAEIRIRAELHVFERSAGLLVAEEVRSESANADVVLFDLEAPEEREEREYAARLEELVGDLPCCFLVRNHSPLLGELVPPSVPKENAATPVRSDA